MIISLGFSLGIWPKAGGATSVSKVFITLGFSLGIRPKAGGSVLQTSSEGPRLKPGVIN